MCTGALSIERGLTMTNQTLEIKPLPALRLAQLTAEVNDTSEIGTMTASLFDGLTQKLRSAGVALTDNGIRTYRQRRKPAEPKSASNASA